MPTPFSTILRGVNRNPDEPLNVLCAPTHEAYETLLCRTGHRFFSVQHPAFKKWDCRFRPVPWNYQLLAGNDYREQVKADMAFDLVLSQNKFGQFQVLSPIATQLNCPLVSLEHTLPAPQWNESVRTNVAGMRGHLNVFISEFSIREWGFDPADPTVRVVHHGIDTAFFDGWIGGDGRILTVVNDYPNRDWCCGFTLYRQVTEGLPVNPWGASPGFSKPAESEGHLRELYRRASIFLNTSTISPVPTALLEAMAVGCPVVTTATCMIPSIVQDGVNGYITNDPAEIRARLQELLANPAKARQLGDAARQTILEGFNESQFVEAWRRIFAEAIDRPL